MAERIQLRRTKGWRKPEGAVVVARPTKWGNEFAVGEECTLDIGGHVRRFIVHDRGQAVDLYRMWQAPADRAAAVRELAGRDLACWCPVGEPCHGDVLLEIANGEFPVCDGRLGSTPFCPSCEQANEYTQEGGSG